MVNLPIESVAVKILQAYRGTNDYILYYQKMLRVNPYYIISRDLAKYIIRNQHVVPKVVNRWVDIHPYSAVELQNYFKKEKAPDKIFIHKVLELKPKESIHIWGKMFEDEKYFYSIKLSTSAFTKYRDVPVIDWSKYARQPKAHQIPAVEALIRNPKFILADEMGLGKEEFVENQVFTPTGRKRIGDLVVGDKVIGSDGLPYNVIGVFPQGKKELFKVTFNDGCSILVGKEHLWRVASNNFGNNTNNDRVDRHFVLNVEQMLDKNLVIEQHGIDYNKNKTYRTSTYYKCKNGNNKWQIPIVKPIQFSNDTVLPIEPYLLGLCLGDGHHTLQSVYFSVHRNDYDELFYKLPIITLKDDKSKPNIKKGVIHFNDELKFLKLDKILSPEKFIPIIYKYSSIENRIALLQGLMDTDGHCMKGKKDGVFSGTEFATVSERLANDVAELVQTLGGIVRIKTKTGTYTKNGIKHICKKVYRLNIKMQPEINPFRLKRKSVLYNPPKKYSTGRYIANIEPAGQGEAVCISVDSPDQLYVTEHAIVTHNTYSAIAAAKELNFQRILVVCPATLKLNWKKELILLGEKEKDIAIVDGNNWQYAKWVIVNYDILRNFHHMPQRGVKADDLPLTAIQISRFDLVIADECFPYNTKVTTEKGEIPIGEIVENNLKVRVLSYNLEKKIFEYKKIDRRIKKENDIVLKINASNGLSIECTPNHKIYVKEKGYVSADKIKEGDELFMLPKMFSNMANETTRIRKPIFKVSNRSRRQDTQNQKMEVFGQKENRSLECIRVESIEILESGSRQSNRKLFIGDKSVYNIEIADNHNYFADGVLVSNCHRLKDASSQRSKIFNNFAFGIPNRWLLTGTPITNHPIDYFNLLQICESPVADNWQRYVKTYCAGKQFTNRTTRKKYWVVSGHSNLDDLRKYTQNIILRRLKTEVGGLPEKIIRPVYLPLVSSVMYEKYMSEYKAWLKDMLQKGEEPPIWDHLTQLIKTRQMLSLDKIPSTVELARDFIDEGKKVVIFTCFTETLDYLMEAFGNEAVRLDGGMNLRDRDRSVEAFQNSPKIKVFCGNIVAGGLGITLTAGEVVIFNDLDWVPTNHVQAEDRVLRIGQKNNVNIFYPLFDDTLDVIMFNSLAEKKTVINTVMGDNEAAFNETMMKYVIEKLKYEAKI